MLQGLNAVKYSYNYFLFYLWSFLKIYALGGYYLLKEQYRKHTCKTKRLRREDLPYRKDHVAIITGGAEGIGLKVVHKLLSIGMKIIIGAPISQEACLNLKNTFESKTLNTKVNVWPLDLSDMESVYKFANKFLQQKTTPLHVLINNAGVMYVPHGKTVDGFETHFQVNYLGHCLLTNLLLGRLKTTGTPILRSRIINVASSVHFIGHINFDDLQSTKYYSPYHGYSQSKLAVVVNTYALQRRLRNGGFYVNANSVHPGVAHTNLYKHVPWAFRFGQYIFQSASEAAETVVYAAVSPVMEEVGGCYLEECDTTPSSMSSYKYIGQERLWDITEKLIAPWTESRRIIK